MSIAAVLLLYGLMVLVFGPSLLRRLTFDGNAPRFGVAAWLTAIVSVLTTWFTAAILFVVDITGHWYRGTFAVSCLAKLRGVVLGDAGLEPQVGMLTLAAGGAVALAVVESGWLGRSAAYVRVQTITPKPFGSSASPPVSRT